MARSSTAFSSLGCYVCVLAPSPESARSVGAPGLNHLSCNDGKWNIAHPILQHVSFVSCTLGLIRFCAPFPLCVNGHMKWSFLRPQIYMQRISELIPRIFKLMNVVHSRQLTRLFSTRFMRISPVASQPLKIVLVLISKNFSFST